ncbi:MAG: hypothetical protein DGJ47_000072 [Rickettsiaceae bacterium]
MTHKIIKYKNTNPLIDQQSFIAQGVVVAGDVEIKSGANIWFNSVLRGDVAKITIGYNTNIQDGSVIHTSRFADGSTIIGDRVTVGHMALLHACTIEDDSFIGMKSVVMDNAVIEAGAFIGAGSLVPPGKIIRKNELWVGSPAKYIRMVSDEEKKFMQENWQNYLQLADDYKG